MAKKKYDDIFLQPDITRAGEYQVFTLKEMRAALILP